MSQLDRQRARRAALAKRDDIARDIAKSSASPTEKALLEQSLMHMWGFVEQACGGEECRP